MPKCLIATGAFFLLFAPASSAQEGTWKPFEFRGSEVYEYKLGSHTEEKGKQENGYILDIREVASKGEEKEFDVRYTTQVRLKAKDLAQGAFFSSGFGAVLGPSLVVFNPMYSIFFGRLQFKVGAEKDFFGASKVVVVSKETVGGREGYVCQLLTKKKEKEELTAEWTIDPALALPIRGRIYKKGRVEYWMELVRYTKK